MTIVHWELADLDHAPESEKTDFKFENINCKCCLDEAIKYYADYVKETSEAIRTAEKDLDRQFDRLYKAMEARRNIDP